MAGLKDSAVKALCTFIAAGHLFCAGLAPRAAHAAELPATYNGVVLKAENKTKMDVDKMATALADAIRKAPKDRPILIADMGHTDVGTNRLLNDRRVIDAFAERGTKVIAREVMPSLQWYVDMFEEGSIDKDSFLATATGQQQLLWADSFSAAKEEWSNMADGIQYAASKGVHTHCIDEQEGDLNHLAISTESDRQVTHGLFGISGINKRVNEAIQAALKDADFTPPSGMTMAEANLYKNAKQRQLAEKAMKRVIGSMTEDEKNTFQEYLLRKDALTADTKVRGNDSKRLEELEDYLAAHNQTLKDSAIIYGGIHYIDGNPTNFKGLLEKKGVHPFIIVPNTSTNFEDPAIKKMITDANVLISHNGALEDKRRGLVIKQNGASGQQEANRHGFAKPGI